MERMPALAPEAMSGEQRAALAELVAGPRGAAVGPFAAAPLRNPALMTLLQRAGAYLRFDSPLAGPLSELAVLLVARQWDRRAEWAIHQPLARASGVAADVVEAVGAGRRPASLPADVAAVGDFTHEITVRRSVSDATYHRAVAELGRPGSSTCWASSAITRRWRWS